jgi:hypothetical protein
MYLRILQDRHSTSAEIEHVSADVERIHTPLGGGVQVDQDLEFLDETMEKVICVLLRCRSLFFSVCEIDWSGNTQA